MLFKYANTFLYLLFSFTVFYVKDFTYKYTVSTPFLDCHYSINWQWETNWELKFGKLRNWKIGKLKYFKFFFIIITVRDRLLFFNTLSKICSKILYFKLNNDFINSFVARTNNFLLWIIYFLYTSICMYLCVCVQRRVHSVYTTNNRHNFCRL